MVCSKLSQYVDVINSKAWSQKKISRVDVNDTSLKTILGFIDYVNSLDEFSEMAWDNKSFDSIMILNEFSDFVQPASVRFDAMNRRTKQLLYDRIFEETEYENPVPTYSDYVKACDVFRSRFKKDGYADVTPLSQLRKPMNFIDVLPKASIGGKVLATGSPFWPIDLVDCDLFEDRYFNDTKEKCIEDYIAVMRFV